VAETTPTCDGVCVHASELGVDDVFTGIAYPHPDCPLHGAPQDRRCSDPIECGHEAALGQALAEVERLTALTRRDAQCIEDLARENTTLTADAERLRAAAHEAEDKVRRVALVRCWTNEDGKRFVFADDLVQALDLPSGEASGEMPELRAERDRVAAAAATLGKVIDGAETVLRQALATWQNGAGNAEAAMEIIADHVVAVDGA
jgi:hypothetical protein